MNITLGNILQIGAFLVMGAMGYANINSRQNQYDRTQTIQAAQIEEVSKRTEKQAELGAREAAILDSLEARMNRMEAREDNRR